MQGQALRSVFILVQRLLPEKKGVAHEAVH